MSPCRFTKICLITLNYNTAENTIKLLDSLKEQTDKEFSLIVIDNHSDDVAKLREYVKGTDFCLLENSENIGFSGGNNRGIHYSFERGADWVLLINSDTWVKPDFIATLKRNLMGREGLCGLPVHEGDAVAYGGRIPWLTSPGTHFHHYEHRSNMAHGYINGAALLISRDTFQRLGQLDENYFLYFEDADYSAMAHRRGIPVSYLQRPIVYHSVSYTTRKLGPAKLLRYQYRNVLYYNRKNGPWYVRLVVPIWYHYIYLRQLLKIMINHDSVLARSIIAAIDDFCHGEMGSIE